MAARLVARIMRQAIEQAVEQIEELRRGRQAGCSSKSRWASRRRVWRPHNFLPDRNRALLQRAGASSPAGTRLLLVDFWTDPTHTQPLTAALMAGAFLLVSGEGDVYSADEVHDWLEATGWRMLERKPLAGPSSLIVAERV